MFDPCTKELFLLEKTIAVLYTFRLLMNTFRLHFFIHSTKMPSAVLGPETQRWLMGVLLLTQSLITEPDTRWLS